jgi:probable F420-dependent oxidoreductase
LLDQARIADKAGIDRLVVPDHVVFGEHLEEYGRPEVGGRRGGKQPTGPDGHWLEPLTALSVICGVTSRIRLGTSILIAALRRPVVLAKAAATLDVLSGGRLDLGVGVGWQREEYEAAGLEFAARGRLLDHTLEVCQALWRDSRAAYASPELRFEAIHMMPKPVQLGGIPIWVSGSVTPHVASRLARFGSGWIPWGPAADDIGPAIRQMRELLEGTGRDPAPLPVVGSLKMFTRPGGELDLSRTMDSVPVLAEAGVTDFRLRFAFGDDRQAALENLTKVATAFHEVAHSA